MKKLATGCVAVVDYGMGNLRSVAQAVLHAAAHEGGASVAVTSDPDVLRAADRVVLPGQGALRDCMHELRDSGLLPALLEAARTKPLFGVCVGMQMLLEHSTEGAAEGAAPTAGLGLIPGDVARFDLAGRRQPDGSRYKVPQMGWNQVRQTRPHALWDGIPDASHFYFVHSYFARPLDSRDCAGEADYGARFCAVLARDNIFATQFHPEKSADRGLQLYRNFLRWAP